MTTEASQTRQMAPQSNAIDGGPFTAFNALLGVIIRPRATFRRMREAKRGHWWVVLLLTLVTLALLTTVTGTIRARRIAEFQAQREAAQANADEGTATPQGGAQGNTPGGGFREGGPGGGGPPGGGFVGGGPGGGGGGLPVGMLFRLTGGPDGAAGSGRISGVLGTAISTGVGAISALLGYLLRGVLVLVFGLVLGGRASFKQVFRMGVWTTLPFVVRNLIQLVSTAVTGNIPVSGLAGIAFSSGNVSPALVAILSRIDIYLLWSLILLGVGVAATTQLSRIKSALAALGYWLVTVAASVGWFALLPTLFGFGG